MGEIRLSSRSAWGIRLGDRVSVSEPIGGVCRPGTGAVGTVSGPGDFREHTAVFPVSLTSGSSALVVVSYSGKGSEVELVRPSRVHLKI